LLGRDASAFSSSFLLGGAVLRHNTSTQLNGENSTLRINSLAMPVKSKSATAHLARAQQRLLQQPPAA
jgi:Fe-S cluster assembly protein SufD